MKKIFFTDAEQFTAYMLLNLPNTINYYYRSGTTIIHRECYKKITYLKEVGNDELLLKCDKEDGEVLFISLVDFVIKFKDSLGEIPEPHSATIDYIIYAQEVDPDYVEITPKQKAINDAYSKLSSETFYPRDNGWAVLGDKKIDTDYFDEKWETCTDVRPFDSTRIIIRPISLRGIENNNGWLDLNDFKGDPQYVKGWNYTKDQAFLIPMNENSGVGIDNSTEFTHFQYIELDNLKGPLY